jgi:hypothetical protein
MKKVLFATTALVATAGVASADIALSGSAQMGIQGGNNTANDTTQFVQDIDITFTMSGTADNGTTFGAAIDLDENAAGVNQMTLALPSSSRAIRHPDAGRHRRRARLGDAGSRRQRAASINDDDTAHAGFNGNGGLDGHYDGQILRYDYSFGDFAFADVGRAGRQHDRDGRRNSALVSCRLQRLTVTRSGASVPSTPACSQAAPSASASVTSGPTTATRYATSTGVP